MEGWLIAVICVASVLLFILLLCLIRSFFKGAQFTEKVDLKGKVAIVTGANQGIGYPTAEYLNRAGAKVYMLCRNEQRAKKAISRLVEDGCDGSRLEFVKCDLSNFNTVRDSATYILQKEKVIDILVNNAGIFACPTFEKMVDGHEMTWQSNHLGPFLLTELLLPLIVKAPEARIVNVSSMSHTMTDALNLDTIDDKSSFGIMAPYNRSKLANVMHSRELTRRMRSEGHSNVSSNSQNPGFVDTNAASNNHLIHNQTPLRQILYPLMLLLKKTWKDGAQTTLFVAMSSKMNNCKEATASSHAMNDEECRKLYDYSLETVGLGN